MIEVKVTGTYKNERYHAVLRFDIHEIKSHAFYEFILKQAILSCESCGLEFAGFEIL